MFRTNNILAASIAAVLAATTAHAATVVTPPQPPELVGGGATLPAVAYVGSSWLTGNSADANTPNRLSSTNANDVSANTYASQAAAGSLFGAFATGSTKAIENISTVFTDNGGTPVTTPLVGTKAVATANPNVSYCQTGSGGGRNVLEGTAAATGTCLDYNSSNSVTGFSAPVDAQFAASDAPLLASDYTAFLAHRSVYNSSGVNTGATVTKFNNKTEPVQFPSVAGAIAVVYNYSGLGKTQLNLTEKQICQVFAGQVATWGQLLNTSDTTPITIVYRDDNSGTSFNFSNHLATVCANNGVAGVFQTNSNFGVLSKTSTNNTSYADANASTGSNSGGVASGSVTSGSQAPVAAFGANGNGALVAEVNNVPGAIGYAEVADAKARISQTGATINYATVSILANTPTSYYCSAASTTSFSTKPTCSGKGNKVVTVKAVNYKAWDPIAGFPKSVKVAFSSDKVLVSSGSSTLETLVAAGIAPVNHGCVQVVDPASIAVPVLSKGDYSQYPIMAVTYLMGFNTGNTVTVNTTGTDTSGNPTTTATTTDVHTFLASLLSSPYSIPKTVTTIGAGTGFAALVPTLDSNAAGGATKAASVVTNCVLQ